MRPAERVILLFQHLEESHIVAEETQADGNKDACQARAPSCMADDDEGQKSERDIYHWVATDGKQVWNTCSISKGGGSSGEWQKLR